MMVSIYDGLQLLEARECRAVRLLDGRPAAIWRGLAFPLRASGDAIDVGGEAHSPIQRAPEALLTSDPYAIIEGAEEAYVLVAGSVTVNEVAAGALREAGLTVLRTGRYLGEPVDGFDADWFVRIVKPAGSLEALRANIAKALGSSTPPVRADAGLRTQLLEAELAAARARAAVDQTEIDRLRFSLADRGASVEEGDALRALMDDERRLRMTAEANMLHLARELPPRPVPVNDSSMAVAPASPAPGRVKKEIEAVLAALLQRIRLVRDSLTVVASEFLDRRDLYRTLRELDRCQTGLPERWKTVQGVDGWIEKSKVGNGQDSQGRVYARLDRMDHTWAVLVSHKGEQDRDIAWLKRQ